MPSPDLAAAVSAARQRATAALSLMVAVLGVNLMISLFKRRLYRGLHAA